MPSSSVFQHVFVFIFILSRSLVFSNFISAGLSGMANTRVWRCIRTRNCRLSSLSSDNLYMTFKLKCKSRAVAVELSLYLAVYVISRLIGNSRVFSTLLWRPHPLPAKRHLNMYSADIFCTEWVGILSKIHDRTPGCHPVSWSWVRPQVTELKTEHSFDTTDTWLVQVCFGHVIPGHLYSRALTDVRSTGAGIKCRHCTGQNVTVTVLKTLAHAGGDKLSLRC